MLCPFIIDALSQTWWYQQGSSKACARSSTTRSHGVVLWSGQVTAAITKALMTLNTNSRYLHQDVIRHAQLLLPTLPPSLEVGCILYKGISIQQAIGTAKLASAHK